MIRYHTVNNLTIAEATGTELSLGAENIPDLMAEAWYNGAGSMIIHAKDLSPEFFDLKTRVAGEILQKFSNYRMKLSIIGDFSEIKSRSLKDFIRESNRTGTITFVDSLDDALKRLGK